MVVENKAGAQAWSRLPSPVDGYTLPLGAGSNIVTSPLINKQLAYKRSDFAPISLLVTSSSILTVHPGVPAKNIKEFIGLAKASKTELTYGSSGIGSPGHLTVELFEQLTVRSSCIFHLKVVLPWLPICVDIHGSECHAFGYSARAGWKARAIGRSKQAA